MKNSMFYCPNDGEQLVVILEFPTPDTKEAKKEGFTWNDYGNINKMICLETNHYLQDYHYCKKCKKLYVREHKPASFQPEGEEVPLERIINESKDKFILNFIKKLKRKRILK